jgi:two-component system, LytTR family, sensor kinase
MRTKSWFFKYKLYHIPFWFVYHVLWWIITIGSVSAVAVNILYTAYSIKFLFYVVFQAFGVYFNLYYLIPHYLKKRQYPTYILGVLLTTVCMAACIVGGYFFSAYISELTFKELYLQDPNFMEFFATRALPSTAASMTLAMSVKLTKIWIEAERKQHVLEKEKLETELKYLKSQFNPHFLFNTINSIFVLIHKNQNMASESLAKFSELLRYQLYECNEAYIPLERELNYIKSFIELSKLRLNPKEVNVIESLPENGFSSLQIAPFILMPFIENAFKHVSKTNPKENDIILKIDIKSNRLLFEIENTTTPQISTQEVLQIGGLGLQNVKRRLALLYPDKHVLDIENDKDRYKVVLELQLEMVENSVNTNGGIFSNQHLEVLTK